MFIFDRTFGTVEIVLYDILLSTVYECSRFPHWIHSMDPPVVSFDLLCPEYLSPLETCSLVCHYTRVPCGLNQEFSSDFRSKHIFRGFKMDNCVKYFRSLCMDTRCKSGVGNVKIWTAPTQRFTNTYFIHKRTFYKKEIKVYKMVFLSRVVYYFKRWFWVWWVKSLKRS